MNEIVQGKRRISGETAILLEEATGIAARQWMSLQAEYELAAARLAMRRGPQRARTPLRPITEKDEYHPDTLRQAEDLELAELLKVL